MASLNLTGILRDPTGEFSYKNQIRFTHSTTTGQTLAGFQSIELIEVDGAYDINVEYGNVLIETWDYLKRTWLSHGELTINSETPATDLPTLLGITTPVTDPDLLVIQVLVADAAASEAAAGGFADDSELSADDSELSAEAAAASAEAAVKRIEWDVDIPFNDGIKIVKGYGTYDTLDVSDAQDESVVIDLPTRSCDFSRASGAGNINKSGVSVTLLDDEPAITSNGISLFGSFTNELLDSEFLLTSGSGVGVILSYSNPSPDGLGSGVGVSGTTPSTGGNATGNRFQQTATVDFNGGIAYLQVQIFPISTSYTTYAFLRNATTTEQVRVRIDVDSDGNPSIFSTDSINGATDVLSSLDATSNSCHILKISMRGTSSADGYTITLHAGTVAGNETAWWGQQLADVDAPYIATTNAAETRAADIAFFPMMGNMPAESTPFTIIIDCAIPNNSADSSTLFRIGNANINANLITLQKDTNDELAFAISQFGSGFSASLDFGIVSADEIRTVVTYSGTLLTGYINGVLITTTTMAGEARYDLTENLFFGSRDGGDRHLNSEIRNFKILHRALTAAEVAALGGAE